MYSLQEIYDILLKMEYTWIDIIAFVFLIDSIGALGVAFLGQQWYLHHMGILGRYFPPAKGWATLYFIVALLLVLSVRGIV